MKYPSGAPKDPEELMRIHEGLIHKIVHQYHRGFPEQLEFDEKKTYVVLAFMRCMKMFDPSKGFKFSSYAGHAARFELWKAIKREIHHTRPGPFDKPGEYGYYVEQWDFLDCSEEGEQGKDGRLYRAGQFHEDDPENIVALRQRVEYIRNTLPEKYAPVFDLMLEGFTQAEACDFVQIAERHQAWNKAYRNRLEKMQKEYGDE